MDAMTATTTTKATSGDDAHEGVPCEASAAQVALVREELGYVPNNLVRVAAFEDAVLRRQGKDEEQEQEHQEGETQSAGSRPAVLLLYPLRNAEGAYKKKQRAKMEPFPTIYWLASSELKARVSTLEDQQFVQELQRRLDASEAAKKRMAQSHRAYAAQRWAMLTEHDRELVTRRRWEFFLRDVGIAGIRDPTAVKCLHTHYAHFLGTGDNLIGEWVQELLDAAATQQTDKAS